MVDLSFPTDDWNTLDIGLELPPTTVAQNKGLLCLIAGHSHRDQVMPVLVAARRRGSGPEDSWNMTDNIDFNVTKALHEGRTGGLDDVRPVF